LRSFGVWLLLLGLLTGCLGGREPLPSPVYPLPSPTATPTPGPAALYEMGLTHQQAGEVEAAIGAFSAALAQDPAFAPAYRARAAAYLALGDPAAALADGQMAVALEPRDAAAHALLGEILRRGFRDPLQALDAYNRAARLDPAMAEVLFPARWECAVSTARSDRMADLAAEYTRLHPDDPLRFYYRGRTLLSQGLPRVAIRMVGDAIREGGDVAALWVVLGDAYAAIEAWSEAVICYEAARSLMERGDSSLYVISGRPAAALAVALGTAYLYAGRCADAESAFRHALILAPDRSDLPAWIGRAMICQSQLRSNGGGGGEPPVTP